MRFGSAYRQYPSRVRRRARDGGETVALARIRTGPTTTEGFNSDVDESKIAPTTAVTTMATSHGEYRFLRENRQE